MSEDQYSLLRLERLISKLIIEVRDLQSSVDDIARDMVSLSRSLSLLSNKVDSLESSVKDLANEVQVVKKDLNNLRREFHEKIVALESRIIAVERRVSEAEKNLDEHLKRQDKVLEAHSEALLNDLAFQIMSVIKARHGELVTLTLAQLHRNPIISIEDYRTIRLLVIAESSSELLQEILERLSSGLKKYTDKEVAYKILTLETGRKGEKPPSKGEPIWTLLADESA